jgi:hypothetical protein
LERNKTIFKQIHRNVLVVFKDTSKDEVLQFSDVSLKFLDCDFSREFYLNSDLAADNSPPESFLRFEGEGLILSGSPDVGEVDPIELIFVVADSETVSGVDFTDDTHVGLRVESFALDNFLFLPKSLTLFESLLSNHFQFHEFLGADPLDSFFTQLCVSVSQKNFSDIFIP